MAQLWACLACAKPLDCSPALDTLDVIAHDCNPSTLVGEAGEQREVEVILDYLSLCLKKKQQR